MDKVFYSKVSLTYLQQLDQLKNRGLLIEDEDKATHLLANISYYRLSGYWYPFLSDKEKHIFKPNSTFDTSFKLYCFDRELRKLVLAEIEKIEVAVRARLSYVLSQKYNPKWFTDPSLFRKDTSHTKSLSSLQEEYTRSDEQFIKAFKAKYSDDLPPSWIMMEVTSFGKVSMLYQNLKPSREKRDIAQYFGLSDSVFSTWIHSIVYLRNVCAHHSRLWNRTMSITPKIPLTPLKPWIQKDNVENNRTFFILSMIVYLLNSVNPKHTFINRFKSLLDKYPQIDVTAMGFPLDWIDDPFWNSGISSHALDSNSPSTQSSSI